MANASTRGWGDPTAAIYKQRIAAVEVDGVKWTCHKAVQPIFQDFLTRMHYENDYSYDEVKDDWGYICRPKRGYEREWEQTHDFQYLSNHSWGLALDVNASKNPMGKKLVTDMPVDWIHQNLAWYKLAWGGDYWGRKDSMHFEFMGTPKDAAAICDRIAARNKDDGDMTPEQDARLKNIEKMLKDLGAPRLPDHSDRDPNRIDLADVLNDDDD